MSTFYLLPPRRVLADHLADQIGMFLPGLAFDVADRKRLAALFEVSCPDVFVVHKEDLPAHERPEQALIDGYGAGVGDEVVEVMPGGRPGTFISRRWRISEPLASSRAA